MEEKKVTAKGVMGYAFAKDLDEAMQIGLSWGYPEITFGGKVYVLFDGKYREVNPNGKG